MLTLSEYRIRFFTCLLEKLSSELRLTFENVTTSLIFYLIMAAFQEGAVLSLLLLFGLYHRVFSDRCFPCSCECPVRYPITFKGCINCENKKLTSVPKFRSDIIKNTRALILRYNHITTVECDIFKDYLDLVVLDLERNKIVELCNNAFTGLGTCVQRITKIANLRLG